MAAPRPATDRNHRRREHAQLQDRRGGRPHPGDARARSAGPAVAGFSVRDSAFSEYIALGDSMSIDLYPALDAGEIDVAVALEWDAAAGAVAPVGAASLLHRNVDERWPEFE